MNNPHSPSKDSFRNRMLLIWIFLALGFVAVVIRVGQLQLWDGEHYVNLAKRNHERKIKLEAKRGVIYDRHQRPLAVSLPTESLTARPKEIKHPENVARALAKYLDQPYASLLKKLDSNRSFTWVERQMNPKEVEPIKKLKLPGITFLREYRRYYPMQHLASTLIGFTGVDSQGLEGLEYAYHSLLDGGTRTYLIERDGTHRRLPSPTYSVEKPHNYSLHLTIDRTLQFFAEKALSEGVAQMEAKGGVAIVMDSHTGAILAMAQAPTFDPNQYRKYSRYHFLNRAVSSGYEPGSTFKLLTIATALELGVIRPNQSFFCENGTFEIEGERIHDVHPFGNLNLEEIVQKSSNICASKIGLMIPKEKFYEAILKYGFGQKPHIGLSAEATGRVLPLKRWTQVDQASMSFGHGILVSPLQMVAAMNTIATGGVYVPPYLIEYATKANSEPIQEVKHPKTQKLIQFGPRPTKRVLQWKTTKLLKKYMKSVVEEGGTATRAVIAGFEVAGKTGTSEVFDEKLQRYSKKKHMASFAGFTPAEDPVFTILVLVEYPKKSAYGGVAAAPIFKKIAEQSLLYYQNTPNFALQQ